MMNVLILSVRFQRAGVEAWETRLFVRALLC